MAFLRYALPALAVISSAAAQITAATTNTCSAATTTIQNGGDATALASCKTFTGSIAIATGTTGTIALDGIEEIQGSLIANNVTGLSGLSADSLTTISDTFSLNGLVGLFTLTFPRLTTAGIVDFIALPNLGSLTFSSGLSQVHSLSIDNTKLNTLTGISLETANDVLITSNPYLGKIALDLASASGSIQVSANGPSLDVSLPNLVWAANMTLINCTTVEIPSLSTINGSLGFYSDYFTTLSGPNLTNVGGTLSISSNGQLSNISLPELMSVGGGIAITGNNQLQSISGLDSLKTVGGDVKFQGVYTNVSLPDLTTVRGAFNLTSSGNITEACSHFASMAGTTSSPIEGKFTCKSANGATTTVGSNPSGTSGSGTSSPTSSHSSASGLLLPGTTGLLAVVAAVFGML